jgi:hypothetical protein
MHDDRRNRLVVRWLTICVGFVAATLFAAIIPLVWHDKLYIDGLTIVRTRAELTAFGNSFSASAFLLAPLLGTLDLFGVQLDTYGLAYGQDLIVTNTVFGSLFFVGLAILVFSYRLRTTPGNLLVFIFITVLFAPFFYAITKELLLFALTLGVLLAYRAGTVGVRGMAWLYTVLLLLFGVYFRIYYLAFGGLFIVHWLLLGRLRWLAAFYLLAAIALVALYNHLPLDLLSKGRANYLEGISSSRIEYHFDENNGVGFLANRLLAMLMLLAPVNLLATSLVYAPFIAVQLFLNWRTLRLLRLPRRDIRTVAAHAVLAFTVVGALFEPDFGSYFRHKVGVLPLMLLVMARLDWPKHSPERARR